MFGQFERLAAAIVLEPRSGNEAAVFERGEQLRDGGRRHCSAASKLRADDLSLGDRLQHEVLGDCERRVVGSE